MAQREADHGEGHMPDLLDRLKQAFADRYRVDCEIGRRAPVLDRVRTMEFVR